MNDFTTVRQNNQVITDLSPAYKAAGYTLPKAVTEASERVLAAAEFPSKVQQAQREAVAARDAYTSGMPVSVFAPGSGIAADYAAALAPIIGTPEPVGTSTEQHANA